MPISSMTTPSSTSDTPKLRADAAWAIAPLSFSPSNTLWMVKPKLISDSDVRITAISVRSAARRVRWNAMPVRRDASSDDTSWNSCFPLDGREFIGASSVGGDAVSACPVAPPCYCSAGRSGSRIGCSLA